MPNIETTPDTFRELREVERTIADATARKQAEIDRLQGQHDQRLLAVLDNEGAHDRRFVPVR